MRLADRILLLVAALLAKLTGLDELLETVALPLLLLEQYRRSAVGNSILRSSDLETHSSKQ
jgi:hypothetical protein